MLRWYDNEKAFRLEGLSEDLPTHAVLPRAIAPLVEAALRTMRVAGRLGTGSGRDVPGARKPRRRSRLALILCLRKRPPGQGV